MIKTYGYNIQIPILSKMFSYNLNILQYILRERAIKNEKGRKHTPLYKKTQNNTRIAKWRLLFLIQRSVKVKIGGEKVTKEEEYRILYQN